MAAWGYVRIRYPKITGVSLSGMSLTESQLNICPKTSIHLVVDVAAHVEVSMAEIHGAT